MKKIMYLHGFASSGASGTVELLRRVEYLSLTPISIEPQWLRRTFRSILWSRCRC